MIKYFNKIVITSFLMLYTFSCIDPFTDAKLTNTNGLLVIDGTITNLKEPFSVQLNRSIAFEGRESSPYVLAAKVSVEDNAGNKFLLVEIGKGKYQTETDQQGIIGRRYKILIQTANGKKYESIPELLKPTPPIDSVVGKYVEKYSSAGVRNSYFEAILSTKDLKTTGDFYRWKWVNYRYLFSCLDNVCFPPICPGILQRSPCCEPCWAIDRDFGKILLSSDNLVNGNNIKQTIAQIPYNSRRPYFIEVAQYSLTKEAYEFWQTASTQISNTGSIFDSPPAVVRGNVNCTSNPEEQVLGYFGSSAISFKRTYISREGIRYAPAKNPLSYPVEIMPKCFVCAESVVRTSKRPAEWRDDYNFKNYDPKEDL